MTLARSLSVLALLSVLAPAASEAATFTAYDSGPNSELITSITGTTRVVMYSVDVGSLASGDILMVVAEGQFENNTAGNVRMTSQLILGSSATATSGTQIDNNNAFNITPDMVRGVPVKIGTIGITAASSSNFVNLIVWTNHTLTVDQNYGRLQVLKIRP